jgi:hypothetical protein
MKIQSKSWLQTTAVAVAIVVLLHHELLLRLGSALPGEPGSDVFRAHWSLWLVAHELPGWPFDSDLVGFPNGVELVPFPAASLLAWAPVTAIMGPEIAHGLLVMAYSALAVFGGHAMVRALGGSHPGGWLAGVLLATQPILGGALRDGTLEVLAVGWMPLQLGAVVLAARGSWRWGVAAGALFLMICMESVYYGSFAALATLGAVTLVRDRRGAWAMVAASVVVAVGAGVLAWVFSEVLSQVTASVAGLGEDVEAVKSSNAADLAIMKQLALSPGERGWRVADLWSPPLAHWVVFGIGGLLALRRHAWLTVLGVLSLLMALDHNAVQLWTDSSIGEVVRFPRRYLAAMAVFGSAAAGLALSHLQRWPRVELFLAAGLGGYLALWGAHAGGYVQAYPLVEIPSVAFADALADDPEEFAVLFAPLEVPGGADETRENTPVFASLPSDLASADLLFFQTRIGKAAFTAPDLLTLVRRPGQTSRYAKAAIDLAFSSTGQAVPGSAKRDPVAYEQEFEWLMGQGLKYLVIDEARYGDEELALLLGAVEAFAVASTHYDDGTGVLIVQLYETRPDPADAPVGVQDAVPNAGHKISGFQGRVTNVRELHSGPMVVAIDVGGTQITCPVKPEDGSFSCPDEVDGFTGVVVRVGKVSYLATVSFEQEQGQYRIRVDGVAP